MVDGANPANPVGIRTDRVVAVVATLANGKRQIGSGYIVSDRLVLTAEHCTRDKSRDQSQEPPVSLHVVRLLDFAESPASVATLDGQPAASRDLDIALLQIDDVSWPASDLISVGRIDRQGSWVLDPCETVGFPLWQLDPNDHTRNPVHVRGPIRTLDDFGASPARLVLRDPVLQTVRLSSATPPTEAVTPADAKHVGRSTWGGVSGALVFYRDTAIGVVVEHNPQQGDTALRIRPLETLSAAVDPAAVAIANRLGLADLNDLRVLTGDKRPDVDDEMPSPGASPLAGLVDVLDHGRLPRVDQLDPYTLGATPSEYGKAGTYGQHDRYVSRTKDGPLAAALLSGHLVVLVGPSKVGKTRTAFEALREHDIWGHALLVAPAQRCLGQLAGHPALATPDPLVIWLDEVQRFLPPTGELSQALIGHLTDRTGQTVLFATLRTEEREWLPTGDGLTRERRMVLDLATSIELGSTRGDLVERAEAAAAYPEVGSRPEGLAEILAGAPALLRRYYDSATTDLPVHTLVRICVDWARCGLQGPIPEPHLLSLARITLEEEHPDLELDNDGLLEGLRQARTALPGEGPVALLRTNRLPDHLRGYRAFDYLIAADDGQGGRPARPVPEATWLHLLDHTTDEDALHMGFAAAQRHNIPVAFTATRRAAEAGYSGAQNNLGVMLTTLADLPEQAEARTWFTKAAQAGHTDAQYHLGVLLATMVDPPDLAAARTWLTKAAQAGHTDAQYHLGVLLATMVDPPDLAGAYIWYAEAARTGHTGAQYNVGILATMLDPPGLAGAVRVIEEGRTALLSKALNARDPLSEDFNYPALTHLLAQGGGELAVRYRESVQRLKTLVHADQVSP